MRTAPSLRKTPWQTSPGSSPSSGSSRSCRSSSWQAASPACSPGGGSGPGAAQLAGVDPQVAQLLAAGAGMPLWFLAAYLTAQLNLPMFAALHARAPWLTLAGLAALVIAVDCLRGTSPLLAHVNMVFLWCAVQRLGFHCGRRRTAAPRAPGPGGCRPAAQPPGGGAGRSCCWGVVLLLLGPAPARHGVAAAAALPAPDGPLPRPPLSANVEP